MAKWLRMTGLVTALLLSPPAAGLAQSQAAKGHPHIAAAQEALKKASSELEAAGNVFGGHRKKALEHVRQAQQELREALEYVKKNPPKK